MCGIAGIVRFDAPGETSRTRVLAMRDQLRHRGPDGAGEFVDSHVALGHTRLALLDIVRGAQPMTSPDGRYTIVYNGEVYNFRDLRRELAGEWQFTTDCDTEVVLAAFARWGEACLPRLNGMFAFFIWDEVAQAGLAARDLLGVKPLAFSKEGPRFVFASEAKAIVGARDVEPTASMMGVLEYLVAPFFSGVERTMFEGVEYLPPGHCLNVSRAGVAIKRWGKYDLLAAKHERREELASDIRQRLSLAVERCLVADVPVGVLLSGGLDSSLIAAFAAQHQTAALDAFTIQFEDHATCDYSRSTIVKSDDLPFAIEAAGHVGARQTIVPVSRAELSQDLARLAAINDALPAWEQELAQHHLARAASQRLKAVLVGDAADETHYGYSFLLDAEATRTPGAIIARLGGAPVHRHLLSDPVWFFAHKYRQLAEAAGHRWETPVDRTLATTFLIVARWLPRLLHNGDIHTMAHSLEARVPFADVELLAAAATVDPRLALANGVEKSLLRAAAKDIVPESIRLRPKSALPKDQGVAEIYKAEAASAIRRCRGFLGEWLDLEAVALFCREDRPLNERERAVLFRVISLAHWCEHFGVRDP